MMANPENCGFYRCSKHPLQSFNGVCSSCLAERLSMVDPNRRCSKPSSDLQDNSCFVGSGGLNPRISCAVDREVSSNPSHYLRSKSCNAVGNRQTLWSLFYSKSNDDLRCSFTGRDDKDVSVSPNLVQDVNLFKDVSSNECRNLPVGNDLEDASSQKSDNFFECEILKDELKFDSNGRNWSSQKGISAKRIQVGVDFVSESLFHRSVASKCIQADSVLGAGEEFFPGSSTFDSETIVSPDFVGHRKGGSLLGSSNLVKKVVKWKMGFSKRKVKEEACLCMGMGLHRSHLGKIVENRCVCCHRTSDNSGDRRSWDGLLIGKPSGSSSLNSKPRDNQSGFNVDSLRNNLINCSIFSERKDHNLDVPTPNPRKVSPRVGSADFDYDYKDMNEAFADSFAEEHKSKSGGVHHVVDANGEKVYGDLLEEWSCGKRFNGWSKIWSHVTASPIWSLIKKSELVLDHHSFSECWQERQRGDKNNEASESSDSREFRRSNSVKSRNQDNTKPIEQHHVPKSCEAANADSLMRKKKNDAGLCRSRSSHYSSPRNLDYGLLRFYLTPMRYSRRFNSRSTRTNYIGRGFLGLH